MDEMEKSLCIYCMAEIADEEAAFENFFVEEYEEACCGEGCYQNALKYVEFLKRYKLHFVLGLAAASFFLVYPMFLRQINWMLLGLGWLMLGAVLTGLPFVTKLTIESMGIKKGAKFGRLLGMIILFATPIWFFII